MRALVIGTPERHQDKLEAFGTFPGGGGGFGIVNAADEVELNQLIIEMPFSWFSNVEVRPFVAGVEGLQQLKQAVDAMAAVPA
jgi:muconolactone delta-isomerase